VRNIGRGVIVQCFATVFPEGAYQDNVGSILHRGRPNTVFKGLLGNPNSEYKGRLAEVVKGGKEWRHELLMGCSGTNRCEAGAFSKEMHYRLYITTHRTADPYLAQWAR
jgi:hypothetical protein